MSNFINFSELNSEKIYASELSEARWLLALGHLKFAIYWERMLTSNPEDIKNSDWDNFILSREEKVALVEKHQRSIIKNLFGLKAINKFLPRDKRGNFEAQSEIIRQFDEYVLRLGLELDSRNFFREADRLL